jgi:hypothetical protein
MQSEVSSSGDAIDRLSRVVNRHDGSSGESTLQSCESWIPWAM